MAARGVQSWTESFLQVPVCANGRQLYGWFIECPSEQCGPSQDLEIKFFLARREEILLFLERF